MYVYRFKNLEGNTIYIGKTEDLKSRLNHHTHLPKECYDEISLIEYSKFNNSDEMSIYERYLINIYSPKYNTQYNNGSNFTFKLEEPNWKVYKKQKQRKPIYSKSDKILFDDGIDKLSKMNVFFRNFIKSLNSNVEKELFTTILFLACNKGTNKGIRIDKYMPNISENLIIEMLDKHKNYKFKDERFYYFSNEKSIYESYKITDGILYIKFDCIVENYLCHPSMWSILEDEHIQSIMWEQELEPMTEEEIKMSVKRLDKYIYFKICGEFEYYVKNGYIKDGIPLHFDVTRESLKLYSEKYGDFKPSDTINE